MQQHLGCCRVEGTARLKKDTRNHGPLLLPRKVKGNVVFTKGGELFPDPFVDIKMGSDIDISGRNNLTLIYCPT